MKRSAKRGDFRRFFSRADALSFQRFIIDLENALGD
jgi:hypothetical protein